MQPHRLTRFAHEPPAPFDISQQERAIELLLHHLGDQLSQPVWSSLPNGYTDYHNRQWFKYTGMTASQCYGLGWTTAIHPDDTNRCVERWNAALNTGCSYELDYRLKAANGDYAWHHCRGYAIKNSSGQIMRWFGICVNRSCTTLERQLIEEQASDLAQQLQQSVLALEKMTVFEIAEIIHYGWPGLTR